MSALYVPSVPVPSFTANEVFPKLWQGSAPPIGDRLRLDGFTHLALCAEEYQPTPPDLAFPGVEVFYAPNDDAFEGLTDSQLRGAVTTARKVANALATGGKVLVTCREGRNRSGLVSALAIHMLTGKPGTSCVRDVHMHRPRSLMNPAFVRMLRRIRTRPGVLGAF